MSEQTAAARTHVTVQLPSGRVVRALVTAHLPGQLPWVTWGGMEPFQAQPMTHEDILAIEAAKAVVEGATV